MSFIESIRQALATFALAGLFFCLGILVLYHLRGPIIAAMDRFRALGRLGQLASILFVGIFFAYGSTKPGGDGTNGTQRMMGRVRQSNNQRSQITQAIAPWTARGAYEDWTQVEFPEGFSFPSGLERFSQVTLMSNGAIRSCLTNAAPLAQLPQPVSIEPLVSSATHGPTASSSYLFAWHDVLINRCATNRADATLELFADGSSLASVTPLSDTNALPTTVYHPPTLPAGYVGNGQDEAWVRGNFALLQEMTPGLTNVEQILSVGYETWLRGWVGINEMNGRYQAAITIPEIPDGPCYLTCGPHKMILTRPGTYRFPLMVFEAYRTRAYPDGIHFQTAYDDGYRGLEESFTIEDVPDPTASTTRARATLGAASPTDRWAGYDISTFRILQPMVIITPNHVPLTAADEARIELWTNMPVRHWSYASFAEGLELLFNAWDEAEIRRIMAAGVVRLMCTYGINTSWGILTIDEVNSIPFPGTEPYGRSDETIFHGETTHTVETNGFSVVHLTAQTGTNSTDLVHKSTTVNLPTDISCYVAVYMATAEDPCNQTNCYNDVVSWHVSANNNPDFAGRTTVYEQESALIAADARFDIQYGISLNPIRLTDFFLDCPPGGSLQICLDAVAQNVRDSKRETCVQIVVYPISPGGDIVGLPDWVDL